MSEDKNESEYDYESIEYDSESVLKGYSSMFTVMDIIEDAIIDEVVRSAVKRVNNELEDSNQPTIQIQWSDIPYKLMKECEYLLLHYDVTQWDTHQEFGNKLITILIDRAYKVRDIVSEWLKTEFLKQN